MIKKIKKFLLLIKDYLLIALGLIGVYLFYMYNKEKGRNLEKEISNIKDRVDKRKKEIKKKEKKSVQIKKEVENKKTENDEDMMEMNEKNMNIKESIDIIENDIKKREEIIKKQKNNLDNDTSIKNDIPPPTNKETSNTEKETNSDKEIDSDVNNIRKKNDTKISKLNEKLKEVESEDVDLTKEEVSDVFDSILNGDDDNTSSNSNREP